MSTFPENIYLQLKLRNFDFDDDARYAYYASGSIANFTKVKIYAPRMMHSMFDDKEHLAYYVEIEKLSEPGYIETDIHTKTERFVKQSDLLDFLADNHILTAEERKEHISIYRAWRSKA